MAHNDYMFVSFCNVFRIIPRERLIINEKQS